MKPTHVDTLERMLDQGVVRLVDVLPEDHYAKVHLPGAENFPLARPRSDEHASLGYDGPIVVDCSSRTCNVSPQTAALLEA